MELFAHIRHVFKLTGLVAIDHPQGKLISYILRCMNFAILISSLIGTLWFCIYEVDTFVDRAMSFTAIVIVSYLLSAYMSLVLRIEEVLLMLDSLQCKIEESMISI